MRQDAREAAAFIRPMLEMDPDKRASAQQMLDHPWLQGLGTSAEEVRFGGRRKASKAPIDFVKSQESRTYYDKDGPQQHPPTY